MELQEAVPQVQAAPVTVLPSTVVQAPVEEQLFEEEVQNNPFDEVQIVAPHLQVPELAAEALVTVQSARAAAKHSFLDLRQNFPITHDADPQVQATVVAVAPLVTVHSALEVNEHAEPSQYNPLVDVQTAVPHLQVPPFTPAAKV